MSDQQGMLPSEVFTGRWRTRQRERTRPRQSFGEFGLSIPEPDVGRLDMRRMPFQREIYEETGELEHLVVAKGTQVGMSTLFVRWMLWVGYWLRGRVLYVMPTQDIADAFSDDRVKRLMEQPVLADKIPAGGTQNKRLKLIGSGLLYFRGSTTETALDNIPARALVLDEYDTLAQDNIPVAEARVGAQDDPMIRRLGVPTLQGYGIHKLYRGTDMRRWLVRCEACGTWQRITWENVRYEEQAPGVYRAWRVCVECERQLEDLLRSGAGEWVAEHPDRERRGYHLPRLIVPGADLGAVVAGHFADDEEKQKNHYNRDLAEPFETPEQRLAEEAITACRRQGLRYAESYVGFNPVTMGIDQAASRPLNVRITEHLSASEKRVLAFVEVPVSVQNAEAVDDADAVVDQSALRRLAQLMQVFKVQMACIDHLPDGIFARAFCAAHPGRAYMVAFNTSPLAKESIVIPRPQDVVVKPLVTVKRSEWIGITLDSFRFQRNLLPLEQPLPKDYEEQLRNVVKERRKDKHHREFYVYDDKGDVDWLMCELYDQVATEVLKRRLAEAAVTQAHAPAVVEPERPTPDMNDWDAKPWKDTDPLSIGRGTYSEDWDEAYRP